MKKVLALLLVLCMAMGLIACGGGAASSAAEAPKEEESKQEEAAPAEEKEEEPAEEAEEPAEEEAEEPAEEPAEEAGEDIVINFVAAQYSDATEAYMRKVCEAFEAEHPGIKINLEVIGWDSISTTVNTRVANKQAPDLYNGGSAGEFVEDDFLYKPEDIISEELKNDFYETFWKNNIDPDLGEVYQIPYVASVRALYCNKKIMDEVGVQPPKTWDEVRDVCAKIKEFYNGDVYAWGIDATGTEGQTTVAYYCWSNGGGYVDDEGNYILNCDANVEGFEYMKELYDNGWTNENPTAETRDDMQKLVAADKMAMLVTACFFPALYPDTELYISDIPYNDKTQSASSTLAVQDALIFFNENAKATEDTPEKLQAIADFCDYFYAPENYTPFMIQEGLLPATNSGAKKLAEDDPEKAAYMSVLEGGKFYARSKQNWKDCATAVIDAAQNVLTGMQTPKEALDEAQATVEE